MSANFGGGGSSQEVDLNITPIIDCFTVLITFMLASASFLSIGFLEAATPGNSVDSTTAEPDTEAVIRLKGDSKAELKIKGKKNLTVTYDLKSADGYQNLTREVMKLQEEHTQINQVLLTAEDTVEYKTVSEVMGHLNESKLPVVVGDF